MPSLVSFKNKLRKFSDLPANEMTGFVKYSVTFPFFCIQVSRIQKNKNNNLNDTIALVGDLSIN